MTNIARMIPGEPGGKILVATDGVQFEVCFPQKTPVYDTIEYFIPEWATLFWFLKDDPKGRPDWNGTNRMDFTKANKMSKSDA